MDYVKFGATGLEVSRICLGCMTYGESDRGNHAWTMSEETSRPLLRQAVELGINFWDTANYLFRWQLGRNRRRAIKDFSRREDIVLATKVFNRMRPGPNGAGLSRKAIFDEIDNSLRRLGTDYVDLYQIHRFDHTTPIEETLEALHDVVKAGKARYIGASSMHAWEFAKAVYISRLNGWTQFVSMQDHLNLLYREEEREMLPFCEDQKIAVIPWSPLARGRLTRDWNESTSRQESDQFGKTLYAQAIDSDRAIIDAVGALARERGVSRAQIGIAWIAQKKAVTAPIVGRFEASPPDGCRGSPVGEADAGRDRDAGGAVCAAGDCRVSVRPARVRGGATHPARPLSRHNRTQTHEHRPLRSRGSNPPSPTTCAIACPTRTA